MTDQPITTKAQLLQEIDTTWTALNAALDDYSETQLTTPRDEQGWTAKDHLAHLAAWERSMVFFLQGKARADGLGVSRNLYLQGDYDDINAAIQELNRGRPTSQTLAHLRAVHAELLTLLEPLSDADLQLPYRHYLPDEPGEGDGPRAIDLLYGNTADHFREHLAWIEAFV